MTQPTAVAYIGFIPPLQFFLLLLAKEFLEKWRKIPTPRRRRRNKIVLPKKYGAEEIIYESACRQAFQRPTAAFHWGKVRTAHKFWWTMASWLDTFVCMHVSGNRSHGCIWSALLIKITGFTTSPSPMTQSCNHPCESFPTSAISCRWAFATKSPYHDSNAYVIHDCNSCNRKFGVKRPLSKHKPFGVRAEAQRSIYIFERVKF